MTAPRIKLEPVFAGDADVIAMVDAFEQCRWPYHHWTHRAHLGVALVYLTRFPLAEALPRARRQIHQYNQSTGNPDGYHETITVLFLRRVERYLLDQAGTGSLPEMIDALARVCDMTWLLTYYSPDRLWSLEARRQWIEPDRAPLDF